MDPRLVHDSTAQAICTASVAAWALAEVALQWRTRGTVGVQSDRGTYWLIGGAVGAALVIATRAPRWAPDLSISDGAWWPIIAGLALFWAGVGLRWWAIFTLGRFFQLTVVVQEGQRVVEDGPYRRLRHPGYAGLLLALLGVAVAFDNLLGVVLAPAVALVGMLPRIAVEERELRRGLGDSYRAYAARTRRLIPGVW